MNYQIDIYHCDDGHVHVILKGHAEGAVLFPDFDAFARFLEVCRQFVDSRTTIPQAFLDAFN